MSHASSFSNSISLLFITITFFGCSLSPNTRNTEVDTRELVKLRYDSFDYTNLAVVFNDIRAREIKADLDKESDPRMRLNLTLDYALELLRMGETMASLQQFEAITNFLRENNIPLDPQVKRQFMAYIGIAFMRHGEIENCVRNHNHESCIIPVDGDGIHDLTMGSENAIRQYEILLREFPNDLESIYLLNIAYMTLGKYPDSVPKEFLLDPSWFSSKVKIKPFEDVAPRMGLNKKSHAGGSVIDDFNNDGWQDIVITSWGPKDSTTLFINDGNGNFIDKTHEYGLSGHNACLHLTKADYNNDGWIDLLLLRGAWYQKQGDFPRTLLMNTGQGFVDVTYKAGLTKEAGSQAAAWADFDLDGWVDLLIANESQEGYERGIDVYINKKDGTFQHASAEYGMTTNHFYKGVVATDVNNDRYPDIYLTSLLNGNFLYINQDAGNGKRKFGLAQGVATQPQRTFPCWAFDFNNDGLEDLFASGYDNSETPPAYWINSKLGKADPAILPKLYTNQGNGSFKEVGFDMGLNEVAFTMGCNFGDINSDGWLDFFLSTGNPAYQSLVPNKMYLNMDGQRFEDVSYSGGFANIQKGHGTSFGDVDHDGDEDMYVVIGGAFDGDFFYNSFYENPNEHNNHWIVLDLEGKTANRKAIGARVAIAVIENGKERMIHRTVTSGASFGGNSFILEVGLRKADQVKQVVVQWPCLNCPDQTFTGMEINKAYKLVEGTANPVTLPYEKVRLGTSGHDPHVQ